MKTMCLIALILSILLFVCSILLGRISHKKQLSLRKNFAVRRSSVLTPFQIFLIGFFLATAVLFFPLYYFDYFASEIEIIKIVKSILLSIHNTMRLFILDGDFEIVKNTLLSANVGRELELIYSIYFAVIFVVAPVLTAGFVLSFFKSTASFIKYHLRLKSDIYVMSEINERSIALAEDILTNPEIKGRKVVLFADVFEKDEEENFELIEQAKRLGAICFRKDITEISLKPKKFGIKRKLFFIGDDEDENVKQALILISRCVKREVYNTKDTQFYVLANSVESETLINSTNNGNMRVRKVCQTRNLTLQTLSKYSIFDTEIVESDKKLISVAIVGLGNYGKEFLKAVCWCGQMDGYKLQIHVFDKSANISDDVKSFAPEIIKFNHKQIEGEAYYDINFYDNTDVNDCSFLEKISAIENISTVYVTLGDDELNINTAMRMRMQFGRDYIERKKFIPPIYAVVYSSIKSATFKQNGGLKSVEGHDYGIKFIGSMKQRYSLSFIEHPRLEEDGLEVHLFWSDKSKPEEIKKAKELYDKFEYYRRASVAQALHIRFREKLGLLYEDDLNKCKILEHKRWNAFMRAEGYVYAELKDDIAKTHYNLVEFDRLSKQDKEKDIIVRLSTKD